MLSLSGGNQQKVLGQGLLNQRSALLLAEEPTQGVDVGARAEIYRILRQAADAGAGVVIVSSGTRELEGLCDRVVVFSSGHVVAELRGDARTEDAIAHAMMTSTGAAARPTGGLASGQPPEVHWPVAWLGRTSAATTPRPPSWPWPSSPWPCIRRGTTPVPFRL